jgi:hypothetical protein
MIDCHLISTINQVNNLIQKASGEIIMIKKIHYYLLVLTLIVITGCSVIQSPTKVYNSFKIACSTGDVAKAESYLTSNAIQEGKKYGVCDAYLLVDGRFIEFKSHDPEVTITGDTAYLTWKTRGTMYPQVIMYKVAGKWKINSTKLFYK